MNRIGHLFLSVLAIAVIVFTGCGRDLSTPSQTKNSKEGVSSASSSETLEATLKGVSLSPRSFEAADFNVFLSESRKAGEIISWAGDWAELNKPVSGPSVVAELSRAPSRYAYVPIIELQMFTQSTGKLLRPLGAVNQQSYVEAAVNFATKYQPRYLGIGIEVNILNEKAPADFDAFVQLFDRTYDAVKTASPDTKVFTVFQLEKMKGLSGGIFGGSNDPSKNDWLLLERFAKADLFAFTTYPGLVFKAPSEMPADYYTDIRLHTSKPVAFSEIGWQSASISADWQNSEARQADFIRLFFQMTLTLKPEFDIWSFLYDQPTIVPFESMGLFRSDGTPKPGWDAWLNLES